MPSLLANFGCHGTKRVVLCDVNLVNKKHTKKTLFVGSFHLCSSDHLSSLFLFFQLVFQIPEVIIYREEKTQKDAERSAIKNEGQC